MEINERDARWLAQVIADCGKVRRGRHPKINVSLHDRDVVGRAASILGVPVRLRFAAPPARSTWTANVEGARAAEILLELEPGGRLHIGPHGA